MNFVLNFEFFHVKKQVLLTFFYENSCYNFSFFISPNERTNVVFATQTLHSGSTVISLSSLVERVCTAWTSSQLTVSRGKLTKVRWVQTESNIRHNEVSPPNAARKGCRVRGERASGLPSPRGGKLYREVAEHCSCTRCICQACQLFLSLTCLTAWETAVYFLTTASFSDSTAVLCQIWFAYRAELASVELANWIRPQQVPGCAVFSLRLCVCGEIDF